jgi:heme-degrading monooxygenase HmoA
MTLVSVTRLRLKSWRYLPGFMWHNLLSCWQIVNIKGFVGGKLVLDSNRVFWTVSLWENKLAMQHYRNSGAHS